MDKSKSQFEFQSQFSQIFLVLLIGLPLLAWGLQPQVG